MTASNGQHRSLSISTLTFHYRTHILTIVSLSSSGNPQFSCCIKGEFCIRKHKGCSLNKGHLYPHLCHLDQAEFHTYSKMGLYMNLQPDRARPSQAKDLIDTEDNIYVRCYL